VLLALLGLGACKRIEKGMPTAVTKAIEKVRAEYCPDRRLGVFDIEVIVRGANLKLTGELTDSLVKANLLKAVKIAAPDFKVEEEIQLLPEPSLGEQRFGIVRVSVANMRRRPNHGSELVNQVLMGSVVSLLKVTKNWYYVQSEDGYLGWMTAGSMFRRSQLQVENWRAADRIVYALLHGVVYSEMSDKATPISDAVLGNIMRRLTTIHIGPPRTGQNWVKVVLPDDREGFLPQTALAEPSEIFPQAPSSPQRVVATAQRFLGIPFLRGGNSTHGFDAAGFVQTVFRVNGIRLLRDPDQQARGGELLDIGSRFDELRPVDLLFFGESAQKIDHLALSLGGARVIHARDYVRLNSLDPGAPDYDSSLRNTFRFARRYLMDVAPVANDKPR
jgi:hypothetical protein